MLSLSVVEWLLTHSVVQTGTGKTYTMGILGSFEGDRKGLVPRCIDDIFSHMTRHSGKQHTWTCKISFMQIYMEMVSSLGVIIQ